MEVICQNFLALLPNQQKWIETTIFLLQNAKKERNETFWRKIPRNIWRIEIICIVLHLQTQNKRSVLNLASMK